MKVTGLTVDFDTRLENLYSYLPHGKSLRLINTIESVSQKDLKASAFFGRLPSCVHHDKKSSLFSGVEYVAQAAALHRVIVRLAEDKYAERESLGFVIAVRNIEIQHQSDAMIVQDDLINIYASTSDKIGNVYQVDAYIYNGSNEKILNTKLTLYEVGHG